MRADGKLFWTIVVSAIISGVLLITFLFVFPPTFIKGFIGFCQSVVKNLLSSWFELSVFTASAFVFSKVLFSQLRTFVLFYKSWQERGSLLKTAVPLTAEFKKITQKVADKDKIDLVRSNRLIVFCHGLLKPRILVSTALFDKLTNIELKTVIAHEAYHVKRKDPLRIFLTQLASNFFSFIPNTKELLTNFKLSVEISADEFACSKIGSSQPLRLALVKTLNSSYHPPLTLSLIRTKSSLWQERIDYLTSPKKGLGNKPANLFPIFVVWAFALLLISIQLQKPKIKSETRLAASGCFASVSPCVTSECRTDTNGGKPPLTSNQNTYYTL